MPERPPPLYGRRIGGCDGRRAVPSLNADFRGWNLVTMARMSSTRFLVRVSASVRYFPSCRLSDCAEPFTCLRGNAASAGGRATARFPLTSGVSYVASRKTLHAKVECQDRQWADASGSRSGPARGRDKSPVKGPIFGTNSARAATSPKAGARGTPSSHKPTVVMPPTMTMDTRRPTSQCPRVVPTSLSTSCIGRAWAEAQDAPAPGYTRRGRRPEHERQRYHSDYREDAFHGMLMS